MAPAISAAPWPVRLVGRRLMMANMPLSTDVTACLPTGAGKAMPGMEGEGADFSAMLEHIKVGAATPQLAIATNLIPAPAAAEAPSTAQTMPGEIGRASCRERGFQHG